jgi:hypothetical protein
VRRVLRDLLRSAVHRLQPSGAAAGALRDELTSRTLAIVDALRSSYKREVLRHAKYWGLDEAL